MAPKSILKKPSRFPEETQADSAPIPDVAKTDPHMATALHHANLIQQQKDIEKIILDASLALLDLPSSPNADPALPTDKDASDFKAHVAVLRPQDYDDLIEERNASRLCGYALCPRANVKVGGDAKLKLVFSKESGIKSVPKKELERWCSSACARRALYVKVQLAEETAWASPSGRSEDIELLVDNPKTSMSLPYRPKPSNAPSLLTNTVGAERLSHENQSGPSLPINEEQKLVRSQVKEKRVVKAVAAPSLQDGTHSAIEGYRPREGMQLDPGHEKDNDEDGDWIM